MSYKINLVRGGIFPILGGTESDSTGFSIPGTFQGEGKWSGVPSLFIRTSACNLRCAWVGLNGSGSLCDTPYSSHNPERNIMMVENIVEIVQANTMGGLIKHIVISGGEPLMQPEGLYHLIASLKSLDYIITVETNGTLFNQRVSSIVDMMSISPKLASSTPHPANLANTGVPYRQSVANRHDLLRIDLVALAKMINTAKDSGGDFQLKFVVESVEDVNEAEQIVNTLVARGCDIKPSDVLLMPEGVDTETLDKRTKWISQQALARGWRFCPRMHIMLFGKNRYV